jgi:hypothetical protein
MLKTLIIATVLLPTLALAQRSQQPQLRQPGQWCPERWMASGNYCVPGSDKAPAYPQKRLVPGRLARERQLLHPLRVRDITGTFGDRAGRSRAGRVLRVTTAANATEFWQQRTNVWRKATSPARRAKRLRSGRAKEFRN